MKPVARFAAWLAVLFGGLALLFAALFALIAAGLPAGERHSLAHALEEGAPLLAFVALILLLASGALLRWFIARYVTAPHSLAEQVRIVLSANVAHRVSAPGGAELAELAREINRLAEAYHGQHQDTDARVAETSARLQEERNRLAALMSELSQGVLLCNPEGRILLYNEQSRALFVPREADTSRGLVGLGRSVFAFLDREQVAHALDKVRAERLPEAGPAVTRFFATLPAGGLARVHLAPFKASDGTLAGFVLMLEDATEAFGQEAQRRTLLEALATRFRQPVANIRAAAENLEAYPDMAEAERARFAAIIATESLTLSVALDVALQGYGDALMTGLALEEMRLADLLDALRARVAALPGMAASRQAVDEGLWVKVDSFAIVQLAASVAARLRAEHGVADITVRAQARGRFAEVDLAWVGPGVASGEIALWESQAIGIGQDRAPVTMRDVLERHGGEAWLQSVPPENASWIRMLLPLCTPATGKPRRTLPSESRPEYYDFDLFREGESTRALGERRLAELGYTVFDTETTGLEPSAGDRIISIGAVRIVNGRLLRHEIYEQLVDPQRPMPRDAVRIHGIRTRDLEGQPTIAQALPGFRQFCEDTVLVAHNAAFDMRFLELAEAESGVRFDQPVLDTLLLSAFVHRNLQDHRLEAIAERLGVPIIGRHTALGDALVTSAVFLKLVPLLAEQGIVTLSQALDASRETYYVRLQY